MSSDEPGGGSSDGEQQGSAGQSGRSAAPPARKERLLFKCLAALPIVLVYLLYQMPSIMDEYEAWRGYGQASQYEGLPPSVLDTFRVYDANADGYIDPYEFAAVTIRMQQDVSIYKNKILLHCCFFWCVFCRQICTCNSTLVWFRLEEV